MVYCELVHDCPEDFLDGQPIDHPRLSGKRQNKCRERMQGRG